MTATNTYFAANALFTFDTVRQLSLVDHSLIADAFCPVVQQIEKDIERDKILTAEQAKEFGLIDQVIASRKVVS